MGTRKFRDPAVLDRMLQDYATSGLSTKALGRKYGCDHTSILYMAKKHNVQRGVPVRIDLKIRPTELPKPKPVEPPRPKAHDYERITKRDHIINEPINAGKTYAEYLRDYERRMRPIRREALRRARETIKHSRSLYTSGRATSD
jgi:hypothetical protein